MTKFNWTQDGAGYKAEMGNNIALFVSPEHTQHFGTKAKRGTQWRAQASQWDAQSSWIYGRDEYRVTHKSYKDAMKAAQSIYEAAQAI